MKPGPGVLLLAAAGLFAAGAIIFVTTSSSDSRAEADFRGQIADKSISAGRLDLLDIAYATASALPMMPHAKNRSRAQHQVVEACLTLDQPRRAHDFTEGISDWRRGLGYAQFAEYCARNKQPAVAERYIGLADRISQSWQQDENSQDWQRDQIQATLARTLYRLDQAERARRVESNLGESVSGAVISANARTMGVEEFDSRLAAVDELLKLGSLDRIQPALETLAELFNCRYSDNDRRVLAEAKIKETWKKVPIALAVEIGTRLAHFALGHDDVPGALEQYRQTRALVDAARWSPEDHIPILCRLATLRFRCGEKEEARKDVAACLAMFDEKRESIADMFRAGALRPLAQAFKLIGDSATALETYRRAVVEGSHNINARPRVQDLVATCVAMALDDVEPDAALWTRIREIQAGLGSPW